MSIEVLRMTLLWCTVINYGIMTVWFLLFVFAHNFMLGVHGKWFRLSGEHFDTR
jgi:hypothetical protein